ncbi:MAG TPA: hypothetical protein VM121_11175 [Acidimicrobiales bacterium]|nr:hypothetical protein [Acidimicrobiales bacterium]
MGDAVPFGGLVLALAGVIALYVSATPALPVPLGLPLALTLLAFAGLMRHVIRLPPGWLLLLALPGGCLLGFASEVGDAIWIRLLVTVIAVVGGTLVADFDSRYRRSSLALPLYAMSCLGVYFTVPDTEQAIVLLAVSVVVAVAAWPVPFVSMGPSGAFASVGLLAWVVAVGGTGRQSAIVGGVGCLALLVTEPVSRLLGSRTALGRPWTGARRLLPAAAIQLLLVSFSSRVVGLRPSVAQAAVLGAAQGGAAMALVIGLGRLLPEEKVHRAEK